MVQTSPTIFSNLSNPLWTIYTKWEVRLIDVITVNAWPLKEWLHKSLALRRLYLSFKSGLKDLKNWKDNVCTIIFPS